MQNTAANNTLIKNVTTFENADNSVTLHIDLQQHNLQVNGRTVQSITMYADAECSGDLAVNWEEEDDSTYKHNTALLMRDIDDSNNNTETMGQFYWEHAFDDTLHTILQQHGFSKAAAEDVCTSEWGMQDVGRASYDAYDIAEQMLAAHNIAIAA
jgi:Asp-tRNA(Asn)/Glu-tRNA(Gln) amidotransferase B subunit